MKRIGKIAIVMVLIVVIAGAMAACTDGADGKDGLSAYDIAVQKGFDGTVDQWLQSLKEGDSAYDLARANGYEGTEQEWLKSLEGEDGTDGRNGRDGKDATFTITDVYAAFKEDYAATHDGTEYPGTFADFLQQYFEDTYESVSIEGMVAEAVLSCVSVYTCFDGATEPSSGGAGVIYRMDREKGDAYVITNYHVMYSSSATESIATDSYLLLYGYERAVEEVSDGKYDYKYKIPATYVGGSMSLDIAVLYVHDSDVLRMSDARAVSDGKIGDSNQLTIGSTAVAIGNPEAGGLAVTSGIVSVDSENLKMTKVDGSRATFRVIRVDTSINQGNSGGGLFDEYGRLIGIVNAKMNSGVAENIAYAIPVNVAVYTADGLIERFEAAGKQGQYAATKCLLGITVTISDSRSVYNTTTKRVAIEEEVSVAEDPKATSPAYGKLSKGDVLRTITIRSSSGKVTLLDITRQFVLIDAMLLVRDGDTVTIGLTRDGEEMSVDITEFTTTEIDRI